MDASKDYLHDNLYDDNKNKKRTKKMAKGICIIMLLSLGLCLVYAITIQGIKKEQLSAINRVKKEQFSQISNYLQILEKSANTNVEKITDNIEDDINSKIDLAQLKYDMDNNILNEDLHNILEENMRGNYLNGINNYRNGIVVVTSDGILEDGSYDRSSNVPRSWDHDIKNSYNPDLKKDAYNKLINHHKDSLIAIEPVNLMENDSNHTKISSMDIDTLESVFIKEGLEGLQNYQFFVPSYITENGDVFGQEDIVQGKRNDTHKIIVIQEFNLYDQIMKEYPNIDSAEEIKDLEIRYENTMNWLYILGCLYVISTIIMLIIVSSMYNNFIETNGLLHEEDKEN